MPTKAPAVATPAKVRRQRQPAVVAGASVPDPRLKMSTGVDLGRRPRTAAPLIQLIALGVAAGLLGGCASGDFGRARDSALSPDMHAWVGAEANASIGLPPSDFQLTDSERELRDRAYVFIEPPRSRPDWKGVFGDYKPIPAPWRVPPFFDRTAYGRRLIDGPHLSQASRYARMIEDVRDDLGRLNPYFAVVRRVADLDQKRRASMQFIPDLSPRERADALARMKENAVIVQWVDVCLQQRIASYRWALERLVVHEPDAMAAEVDRLIGELSAEASITLRATPVVGQVLTVKG